MENIPHIVKNVPATEPSQSAMRIKMQMIHPWANHYTHGLQLQTDWLPGKNHYIVAGIDYWKKNLDGFRDKKMQIEVLNPTDNSVLKIIDKTIAERPLPFSSYASMGFFVQDEFRTLYESLSLTFAARIDQITTENQEVLNPLYEIVNGEKNYSPAGQKVLWKAQKETNRSWSGNLGLLYRLRENLRFTATLAKAFRSPYLEERYLFVDLGNLVKIGEPNLQPEKSTFADLGLSWQGNKLSFRGNVFLNLLIRVIT